jgi:D-3-phosphoglycerate dehydrogenase
MTAGPVTAPPAEEEPPVTARERKFKVVVQKPAGGITYDLADSLYAIEREALDAIGAEIVEIDARTEEEFLAAARDADAVIARNRRITAPIVRALQRCKVIGLGSVGADTVDVDAATAAGIVVTNVPDVFIDEVADHTMAMFLAAHRRLRLMHQLTVEGRWKEGRPSFKDIPRLYGQTIGLISFGNVAKAVARRCHAFGLHVIAYDPFVAELEMTAVGVEPVTSLVELCRRSDFVSMHAPLNEETHHLMGEALFEAMKRTAIFVNNGRGATVDEPALIKALQEGWIAGAALDVFEQEPVDTANPLLKMDNVIVTPHIASATARMAPETRRRLGREIATVLQGRWPRSAVNPGVLPKTDLIRWQPYPMGRGPNR